MSRRRKKNVIKGPIFDSFRNQHFGMKKILVWKPGTQSLRQRLKYLSQQCRTILDSRDSEVIRVGQLVLEACRPDVHPKLTALILTNAGLEASNSTGESWPVCTAYLVNKYLAARVERLKGFGEDQTATMDVAVSPPTERIEDHASTRASR